MRRTAPGCSLALVAVAALAPAAAAQQDFDLFVSVDRTAGEAGYEAEIVVTTLGQFAEVRIAPAGETSIPLDDEGDGGYSIELEADGSFVDFLTNDATGDFFDVQFFQAGGAVSVYRFQVGEVFGPQVDLDDLPLFATDITGTAGAISWTPPAGTLGDLLLVGGERMLGSNGYEQVLSLGSPIPFAQPLLLLDIEESLMLSDTSAPVPAGEADDDFEIRVEYGTVLGLFTPTRVSGPALDIGNTFGYYSSVAFGAYTAGPACPGDINGDGFLNNTDINIFVTDFINLGPAGDFNGDGFWNNTDINQFVTAFTNGCG